MGHRQRQLLLFGCAILALVGAFMGYRLIRPQLGPARTEHDPLNGPREGLAPEAPPRILGAAGAGTAAATPAPPPPTPPTSNAAPAPSIGRFRATGIVQSGSNGPGLPRASVEIFEGTDAQGVILGRGEADVEGRFAIDLPSLDRLSPERRSQVSLAARARAKGHRIGHVMIFAQEDLSGAPRDVGVELTLDPGHDVFGRVVDEGGRPVDRVRMTLYGDSPMMGMLTEVTDAEGRYRFPIAAPGTAFLLAHRFGVGTASIPETPLSLDADLELPDLVLRRGAEIAGTVVNAAGRPIAGVPVYAQCLSMPRGGAKAEIGAPSGTDFGSAMTDAEGRFRIPGIFPGRVRLTPVAERPSVPPIDPFETGRTDVRLVVSGHVLRVAVVDSDGAPLVGPVWSVTETDTSPPRAQSGMIGLGIEGGNVGFAVVMEGASVRVAASHPGCAGALVETKCEGAGPSEVTLRVARAGAPGRVRLTLTGEAAGRARSQRVNVTSPATGAVDGYPHRVTVLGDTLEVPSGKRRIEVLPLEGSDPFAGTSFLPTTIDVDVPSGGDLTVPVPVQFGGRVQVTLVWPEGAKRANLDGVRLRSLDGATVPEDLPWLQKVGTGASMGSSMLLETTQPITTAVGLAPGRWLLELDVKGYATAHLSATVTAGETTSVTAGLERKGR